ncbi:metallo-beta-lactamase [Frankia sp. R43]|uniref:MBL fold metallo-hydrolase n=1 Tax=Frankia sp. R43 TaxID=269536 RepID=UPI0006CA03FD|nr:MBL fold metallo-hydrolase [Frankia sp. R43]KPM55386.1 metallo-beta-lactamase [Frankia sp. R43]
MDVVELVPDLYFLRFPVGHVYLWRDPDGLTVIDAGLPGSGPHIAEAIRGLGWHPRDVRQLVLTHGHVDHAGAAAEVAAWGEVTVLAHQADVPLVEGRAAALPPDLADWEQALYDQVQAGLPAAAAEPVPVRVDRPLADGDIVDIAGGALTIATPGHTAGSIALYLPGPRVLFAGDIMARDPQSTDPRTPVFPGVFNVDRAEALASFARLAALDVETACFGHGDPLASDAGTYLRAATERLSRPTL